MIASHRIAPRNASMRSCTTDSLKGGESDMTKGMRQMTKTYTPKEVALKWGTTPRTLRKFLRTTEKVESPGKGGRYAIEARKVASLKKGFDAWKRSQDEEAAKRREALAAADSVEETESLEGDEVLEDDESPEEDEVTE